MIFIDRISRRSHCGEGLQFGGLDVIDQQQLYASEGSKTEEKKTKNTRELRKQCSGSSQRPALDSQLLIVFFLFCFIQSASCGAALLGASWSDCSYLSHCAETADNIHQVLPLKVISSCR